MEKAFEQNIIISNKKHNPYQRSTIFKYKVFTDRDYSPNEKISSLTFLYLLETYEGDFEDFTTEESITLKERLTYQCVRFNLIENIYDCLIGKTTRKLKDPTYYCFITAEMRIALKKLTIPYNTFNHYRYVRDELDILYVSQNDAFREFYFDYFLNKLNKNITAHNAKIIEQQQTNNNSQSLLIEHQQSDNFIRFNIKTYRLPIFKAKKPNHATFFDLLHDLVSENSTPVWRPLLIKYNAAYSTLRKSKENKHANFSLQTSQYLEQITIYICMIKDLIKKYPDIEISKICSNPNIYESTYKPSDDPDTTIATIKETTFNPIEINITGENVTLKDINQYIALLIEMEHYFFSTLESIFILTLEKNNDITPNTS